VDTCEAHDPWEFCGAPKPPKKRRDKIMSITTGIQRCKKTNPIHSVLEDVSWKNRYFDMWVTEYLYLYPQYAPVVLRADGESSFFVISETLITRMAQDLLNENFCVCKASEWFVDDSDYAYAKEYGKVFLELCHNMTPDEILVYYDCGH